MIHFSCDACGQPIDREHETRYVVRLEVYAAVDEDTEPTDPEVDHLEAIEDMLERMEDSVSLDDELYQQLRYDLCPTCRERLLADPLARLKGAKLGFSNN
ncbi:hypothetical protein [Botrimarina hoheduenensis]|uniref:Uncharacterized protein n=1 Tax=Botrimarina hoheduenensis TaxID=2528000 RepID=A0A5C5VZK9_9BACT|nr:hypothetical protein [Botrimarina hoheduenensis]TWT42912.1 hypothetical protein Pla111_25500 [Botrimarina hoheduenensis]